MIEVLFRHGGTFDKYVGDELMALFGAPTSMPSAPQAAVVCALDMQKELGVFNQRLVKSGRAPIAIGIGIHTGRALCGTLGSSKTMQYTAIGDTVNTASRLCSVAGPGQVLLSAVTMELVHGEVEVRELPAVVVKGKSRALEVFDTVGRMSSSCPPRPVVQALRFFAGITTGFRAICRLE
ncbi:MAG: adenylate/guanylate cyclase domain-containing protein [Myxococcota bacterium]